MIKDKKGLKAAQQRSQEESNNKLFGQFLEELKSEEEEVKEERKDFG